MMTYYNYSVFPYEIKPLNSVSKTLSHKRKFIGKVWQNEFYYFIEQERFKYSFNFKFDSWEEMKKIRDFFFMTKGRANLFWMPSWNNDLLPIKIEPLKITIEKSFFELNKDIHRPIVLYLPDFDFITYATTIKEEYDEDLQKAVNRIYLNDNLPAEYDPSTCSPIQLLFLGRWDTDTITFNFIDLVRGSCSIPFSEITNTDYKRFVPDIYNNIYTN